ncbi:hypothetical protein IEU95_02190 [Hoyosella rhizosphaerae]|uniref:Uncharacterized protein n=1 Tax=Hoyosella rhizosphaerae TaxID=1755582 RepID=A0A916XF74_9ACTN|nr:hypothetical protein [Hoyosella rhizosphaerae]MBN4925624.1 hypothetical protein [Hoyosella rhizosphaerae]GGC69179.1 hypothetical protein GCM10011410_22500 [Hoyosella rhizosphaerae]
MGKVKAAKVSQLKPKKKCCRSKNRCLRCPYVIAKMKKLEAAGVKGGDLKKQLKRVRAA